MRHGANVLLTGVILCIAAPTPVIAAKVAGTFTFVAAERQTTSPSTREAMQVQRTAR